MSATNVEVAARLGISMSGASRMRAGKRYGSPRVLLRVAEIADVSAGDVLRAVVSAEDGDKRKWNAIMDRVFGVDGP